MGKNLNLYLIKNIYRLPIIWKDAHHDMSSGNCKSKQDTNTHLLEGLRVKTLKISIAGEDGMFSLKKRHTKENCLASIWRAGMWVMVHLDPGYKTRAEKYKFDLIWSKISTGAMWKWNEMAYDCYFLPNGWDA